MERNSTTAVATVTDEDGAIEALLWEQTAGTTVELTNNNSETLEFHAPDIDEATTLTFKLTATDDKGSSRSQELTVNLSAYAPLSSLTISDAAPAQCLSDTHQDVGISIVECADYPIATFQICHRFRFGQSGIFKFIWKPKYRLCSSKQTTRVVTQYLAYLE